MVTPAKGDGPCHIVIWPFGQEHQRAIPDPCAVDTRRQDATSEIVFAPSRGPRRSERETQGGQQEGAGAAQASGPCPICIEGRWLGGGPASPCCAIMAAMETGSWLAVAALAVSGFSAIFSAFAWHATRRQAESAERMLALELGRRDDEVRSGRAADLLAGSADITIRLLPLERNVKSRAVVISNVGQAFAKDLRLQVLHGTTGNGAAPNTEHRFENPQDLAPGASYSLPVEISVILPSGGGPYFTIAGRWRDIRGEVTREWDIREHPETETLVWST